MLNYIWLGLILGGVLVGGFSGRIKDVVESVVQSAQTAVTLALGLVGLMALWLGMMRLAEKAGLIQSLARALRPMLKFLFPSVPAEHPAMGSMLMNIAANMLGLNNAATPLGIRAMRDLESLNPHPGVATNAMCTFLAINTSSVQLIPMTAVALLAAAGSKSPASIIGTAILSTLCAAVAAVTAVKTLEKLPMFQTHAATSSGHVVEERPDSMPETVPASLDLPTKSRPVPPWGWVLLLGFGLSFVCFFIFQTFPGLIGSVTPSAPVAQDGLVRIVNALSVLAIPFLIGFFPFYAALRGIPVYEEFVEGAKEGFQVALRIIPFLVGMLVAIGVFRSAGAFEFLGRALRPILDLVGFPSELVPLALMRPLSGSASLGLLSELVKQHGPDSLLARTAATLYGSTETTFYVIAVYFGAVSVRRTRHAVPAGLIADVVGAIAAVVICRLVFGS
jgi:spore maturation protein SpmA